jgi:hypothetical protein
MSRNRLEYHQGAIADAKSAVAWYKKHSPRLQRTLSKNCVTPPKRSLLCQIAGRQARTTPDDFCFGDFHFPSSIRSKNP